MWAHPYLQAVNLVTATKEDPHTWTHDGDMSETFGLEPNFGCCTVRRSRCFRSLAAQPAKSPLQLLIAARAVGCAAGRRISIKDGRSLYPRSSWLALAGKVLLSPS